MIVTNQFDQSILFAVVKSKPQISITNDGVIEKWLFGTPVVDADTELKFDILFRVSSAVIQAGCAHLFEQVVAKKYLATMTTAGYRDYMRPVDSALAFVFAQGSFFSLLKANNINYEELKQAGFDVLVLRKLTQD